MKIMICPICGSKLVAYWISLDKFFCYNHSEMKEVIPLVTPQEKR